MSVTTVSLETEQEWEDLYRSIDAAGRIGAVKAIVKAARDAGAVSALIEYEYLDQDFTAEFSAFYSKVFKRYSKVCRRFHFFDISLAHILGLSDPAEIAKYLTGLSKKHRYIGFIVVRPIEHAPLGRVVFRSPASIPNTECELLVRSKYDAHVLGAVLRVYGIAFTQQDARIGACAQASIWMAGRHFHSEHRGPWMSVADITEAATRVADQSTSQHIPAGSGGLTVDNIVRALREMGRYPLLYRFSGGDPKNPIWRHDLKPETIIHRYVDSGIPVIVGLGPWEEGQSVLHAVLATGLVREQLEDNYPLPAGATRAEYCQYFLVHDDQRGVNLRMPRGAGQNYAETPYTIGNILYLIVPMPEKVYIPAEHAENIAWDAVRSYRADWDEIKKIHTAELGSSVSIGDQFCRDFDNNRIVARTYLTYGWRYKRRMLANSCTVEFKAFIYNQDLPRLVWVTEFGNFSSFNHLSDDDASIYGHAVVDATSSDYWESRCVFHAPGYAARWFPNETDIHGPYDHAKMICPSDKPYNVKVRGK